MTETEQPMSLISIENFNACSGPMPVDGYDTESGAGFTLWTVGNAAGFRFVIPENYRSGNDLFIILFESASSASANHSYAVNSVLLRSGIDPAAEKFTYRFRSPSSANLITRRSLKASGSSVPGAIAGRAVLAGDVICVNLQRISSSTGEDPNPVKIFAALVEISVETVTNSPCSGRVGKIVDSARDLFNESCAGFLSDEFILRCINRCIEDLAQEDYWRSEKWISCARGATEIDLLEAVPKYQKIFQVTFQGCETPLRLLASYQEYLEFKGRAGGNGVPQALVIQNNSMHVWPAPDRSLPTGFRLYHSCIPDEITCSSENPNPPVPRAHDIIFVYYTLKHAFLRDRHAPGADLKFQEYSLLYDREKRKLLGEADSPGLRLRTRR